MATTTATTTATTSTRPSVGLVASRLIATNASAHVALDDMTVDDLHMLVG